MLALTALTGCGSDQLPSKGNYDVFGCIEKLDANNTLEEMNEIIGFEGELSSDEESYKVYDWELNEETSITVQFFTKNGGSKISANYPNKMITKAADFSRWEEIKEKINDQSLTYEEFVEMVGGVEGTMDAKTTTQITYKWLNAERNYLSAYFSIETGKCEMATGRF